MLYRYTRLFFVNFFHTACYRIFVVVQVGLVVVSVHGVF